MGMVRISTTQLLYNNALTREQEFAYNQALYLLIRLLQRYDRIEPAWTPDKKPMHVVGFTLQIKNAVMIRMKEVVDQ